MEMKVDKIERVKNGASGFFQALGILTSTDSETDNSERSLSLGFCLGTSFAVGALAAILTPKTPVYNGPDPEEMILQAIAELNAGTDAEKAKLESQENVESKNKHKFEDAPAHIKALADFTFGKNPTM